MKVTICLSRGRITIASMSGDDVMAMLDEWHDPHFAKPVMTATLDGNAVSHIARSHVVRIDVDEEDES